LVASGGGSFAMAFSHVPKLCSSLSPRQSQSTVVATSKAKQHAVSLQLVVSMRPASCGHGVPQKQMPLGAASVQPQSDMLFSALDDEDPLVQAAATIRQSGMVSFQQNFRGFIDAASVSADEWEARPIHIHAVHKTGWIGLTSCRRCKRSTQVIERRRTA
jgi:hypothetical protein